MAASNFLDVKEESPAERLFSNFIKQEETLPQSLGAGETFLDKAALHGTLPTIEVTPQAGFCVKARELNGEKVFINICYCDEIPPPLPITEEELMKMIENEEEVNYRIPLSIGPLHREVDKGGASCQAYDVVVNTLFFKEEVAKKELFSNFLIMVSLQGLEEKYNLSFSLDTWVVLKNKKYFGTPGPHFIQDRSKMARLSNLSQKMKPLVEDITEQPKKVKPLIEDITEQPKKVKPLIEDITDKVKKTSVKATSSHGDDPSKARTFQEHSSRFKVIDKKDREIPVYKVYIYPLKGYPTHLKYIISLPKISSSSHLILEVSPARLLLTSFCYHLELELPYLVMKDSIKAYFNNSSRILLVTLPIIPSSKRS